MSAGRIRRCTLWLGLVGCICLPLVALGWATPASALGGTVSISVVSSQNPSPFGQDVTYTATLTTSDQGGLVSGDGLEFTDNGNEIFGCNNSLLSGMAPPGIYTATCDEPNSFLSVGTHNIVSDLQW